MIREKIKRGQTLKTATGGVLYALSNETASGEVLVRSPADLRRCVYLPVGDVLPIKLKRTSGKVIAWRN